MSIFYKYLPWQDITISSGLTTTELKERLSDQIEPKKIFRGRWFPKNTKPYEGHLKGDTFEISRLINYRNSFRPVIKGRIYSDAAGSKIAVKIRLHPAVYAFTGFVSFIVLFMFLLFLVSSIRQRVFQAGIFIPPGIFLFLVLMVCGGFGVEAGRSRKDLEQIFQGKSDTY